MLHLRNVGRNECFCCESVSESYTTDIKKWLDEVDTCNKPIYLVTNPPLITTTLKDLIRHAYNIPEEEFDESC